jgi:hypothetical protein
MNGNGDVVGNYVAAVRHFASYANLASDGRLVAGAAIQRKQLSRPKDGRWGKSALVSGLCP